MVFKIRLYKQKEISLEENMIITEYVIKIERSWFERITLDGLYYIFENLEEFNKMLNLIKQKYKPYKIIDEDDILLNINLIQKRKK